MKNANKQQTDSSSAISFSSVLVHYCPLLTEGGITDTEIRPVLLKYSFFFKYQPQTVQVQLFERPSLNLGVNKHQNLINCIFGTEFLPSFITNIYGLDKNSRDLSPHDSQARPDAAANKQASGGGENSRNHWILL